MKIEKATKKDIPIIAEIMMIESAKKPYNEKYNLSRAIKEVEELSKNELYVAKVNNLVVGFISSHIIQGDKKKSYIDEIWLRKDYQKKGIGTSLMSYIEKFYRDKGIKIIRLTTKKKAEAFRFYQKLKYKDTTGLIYLEKELK